MRGEHGSGESTQSWTWGSSPRARGAPITQTQKRRVPGIIPACAGSTPGRGRRCRLQGDHPRVRGEHWYSSSRVMDRGGSSPRARGAPDRVRYTRGMIGIIPACAGSTAGGNNSKSIDRDHPRVRGEHGRRPRHRLRVQGSSPRARGALHRLQGALRVAGIIPACAGSTSDPASGSLGSRDHPRVRGEHPSGPSLAAGLTGSSPRARGARGGSWRIGPGAGIIPACAGSTHRPAAGTAAAGDHPRVRGEHPVMGSPSNNRRGSSPRARGAPIVPSDATIGKVDHPRVRGEHKGVSSRLLRKEGSSPRARGALV